MSVDARHAGTVGLLSAFLANQQIAAIDFQYKHGTPVDIPRNELFAKALASDVDVLVWMDSDCFLNPSDIHLAADLIMETHHESWAYTTAATPQRDGHANVWKSSDTRFTVEEIKALAKAKVYTVGGGRIPIHASGLGFAVFGLAAFRNLWNRGPWFCSRHGNLADGTPVFQSEDYTFTSRMPGEMEGLKPHCDVRFSVNHVHRGGHE